MYGYTMNARARFALDLIKRDGMKLIEKSEPTPSGQATYELLSPWSVAERALEISFHFFEYAEQRGWIKKEEETA